MSKRANNEGSIYRRPSDGRWVGALPLPNGRRKAVYGSAPEEAREKLRHAQRRLEESVLPGPARLTVARAVAPRDAGAPNAARTFQRYEQIVRLHLTPALGNVRRRRLASSHVERRMAEGMAAGQSASSVNHWRGVLRAALNATVRHGLLVRNVAALAQAPASRRARCSRSPSPTRERSWRRSAATDWRPSSP